MKYRLCVYGNGGEFSLGIIEDKEEQNVLMEKIENKEELSLYNYSDNNELEVNYYQYKDIINIYGVDFNNCQVLIEKIDEHGESLQDIEYFKSSQVKEKIKNTPYIDKNNLERRFEKESLVFGGTSFEKRMVFIFELEIDKFNIDNLAFLTINLEKTFGNYKIISDVFYLNDETKNIWNEITDIEDKKLLKDLEGSKIIENDVEPGIHTSYKILLKNLDGEDLIDGKE